LIVAGLNQRTRTIRGCVDITTSLDLEDTVTAAD